MNMGFKKLKSHHDYFENMQRFPKQKHDENKDTIIVWGGVSDQWGGVCDQYKTCLDN